jgi:hypothetical protein
VILIDGQLLEPIRKRRHDRPQVRFRALWRP